MATQPANYTWIDNWCRIPDTEAGRTKGRTHSIVYSEKLDRLIALNQNDHAFLVITRDGTIERTFGPGYNEPHGLTIINENGEDLLWFVDVPTGKVCKLTLDGREVLDLAKPDIEAYRNPDICGRNCRYIPTWAVQHPINGEIWVADGYGSHLVNRYSYEGKFLQALDGTESGTRFNGNHGIRIFPNPAGEYEVWVADRSNHRIAIYSDQGIFRRESFVAHSPSDFDYLDGKIVIPELFSGVKIIDAASCSLIQEIGKHPEIHPHPEGLWWPPVAPEGWPNLAGTAHVRPGLFNSPHGACFDPDGNIYVAEWIIGGRITKLLKS